MMRCTVAILALALVACDVVTNRYATISEAREDRLFERGWLPDILPPSSVRITVSNDLDLNTSEGEFSFASSEFPAFRAHLATGAPERAPFRGWSSLVRGKLSEGYGAWQVQREVYTWVFLCHERDGHCVYRMWPTSAG